MSIKLNKEEETDIRHLALRHFAPIDPRILEPYMCEDLIQLLENTGVPKLEANLISELVAIGLIVVSAIIQESHCHTRN